jgi:hypothetical protein
VPVVPLTGLSTPGPASRQHPSECFHSKNSSGPVKRPVTVH